MDAYRPAVLTAFVTGTQTAAAGKHYFVAPYSGKIHSVRLGLGTAPTGAVFTVDVNKNGTTIYTTQANRPTVAISATTGTSVAQAYTKIAAGDVISVDVDVIGSSVAGSNLAVSIILIPDY